MESDLLNDLINAAEDLVNNTQSNQIREIDIFNEEKSEETSNNIENESVVHTGLSDSSDDEDNKYFEEAKYNEYGKNIKKLLQNPSDTTQFKNISDTWKTKHNKGVNSTPSKDVYVDPFFGIRIINPLVSSQTFRERMVDRESVPMVKLKWYVQKLTPEKNWVIAGVIVQKSATKTSQKGNQFCIWTLSDLHGDLKTATVFLFGKAYQNLWKTVVGTVVGILNPNVFTNKDKLKAEACLSVDNHQKVMILGQSKDFGICKSTKKSGESCTAFVNTNQSEHCIYHLKQEYQKYSKRSDMQSSFQGRGLTALRNKVLGKNEVFYAGKSYMAIPATKSRKLTSKDDSTLKALKGNAIVNSNQVVKAKNLGNRKKSANRVELGKHQRVKDMALLRRLGANKELDIDLNKKSAFMGNVSKEVSLDESKQTALSVINKLKGNRSQSLNGNDDKKEFSTPLSKEMSSEESKAAALEESVESILKPETKSSKTDAFNSGTQSTPNEPKSRPFLNNLTNQPSLKQNPGTIIDLNSPISRKLVDKAKLNALKYVQKNGQLKKSDPMSVKGTGKKRNFADTNLHQENDPKKQKILENEFFSERFKKMMATTSTHTDLLEKRDEEEQEKYFKRLEIKEKMEEKMATTFKIECKAVRCLKCKYTNFSASDRCKAEKHPLKVFDSFKRFFKCGDCGNRTVCLEVVPIVACKNCGSGRWERTSMMKERNVQNLHSLSIRGGEQKFLNSTISDANLSLLVSMD